jgi:hypothetical protein
LAALFVFCRWCEADWVERALRDAGALRPWSGTAVAGLEPGIVNLISIVGGQG